MERLPKGGVVVPGGENDHVAAPGHDGSSGELPQGRIARVVGEVIAAEVKVGDLGVVDFDPVGSVAVVVDDAVVVGGQKLGDHRGIDRLGAEKEAVLKRLQPGSGSGRS